MSFLNNLLLFSKLFGIYDIYHSFSEKQHDVLIAKKLDCWGSASTIARFDDILLGSDSQEEPFLGLNIGPLYFGERCICIFFGGDETSWGHICQLNHEQVHPIFQ